MGRVSFTYWNFVTQVERVGGWLLFVVIVFVFFILINRMNDVETF